MLAPARHARACPPCSRLSRQVAAGAPRERKVRDFDEDLQDEF